MHISRLLKISFWISFLLGYVGVFGFVIDLGPFSLYPFRLFYLILVSLIAVRWLTDSREIVRFFNTSIKYGWFFLAWLIYLIFLSIWIVDLDYAKNEIFNLFILLTFILISIYLIEDEEDFHTLMRIWLFFYILNLAIGTWEVMTGNHLPTSKYHISSFSTYKAEVSILYKRSFMPTTFFNNQNNFATYLTLSIPLVFFYVRNTLWKLLLTGAGIFLLLATLSRANLIALFAEAIALPFFLSRRQNAIYVPVLITSMLLSVFTVYIIATTPLNIKDQRIQRFYENVRMKIVNFMKGGMGKRELSTRIRIGLIQNSIYYFEKTSGLGTGPGQLEYYIDKYPIAYTYYLKNPHNWWLEILAKYGIPVFLLYILFLIYLFYNFLHFRECPLARGFAVALLGFIPGSISPSGMMTFFPMWAFFIMSIGYIKVLAKERRCVL